ncbi:helix-turn-helix domain-containing protein [Streptomyces sp. NPDC059396]|uniref:helix-turn-helix domain-containing protein n=1 Tax=Streptomyces sp. NPDC059396 TaxID=3346819 RepID=UPI003685B3C5
MSLDPILWALKDAPVADSLERLVLVTLGERAARADGCTAFPSRDTIAETVMADPKTVQRVLGRLVKRGLIAKGDQSAARYIRADRRPTVYDLLIPYSWFPNPDRMNAERLQAGLPPLTPQDRPDIAPPPDKKRRSDLGQPRAKKPSARGDSESPRPEDSQSPRTEGNEGTESPVRGDSESPAGGLKDPRTSPVIIPLETPLPPVLPPAAPPRDAREGGRDAAPTDGVLDETERQAYSVLARIAAADPRLTLGEREIIRLAPLAARWLERGAAEGTLRQALTAGLPERVESAAGLVRRRLLDKLPPQRPQEAAGRSLPPWCGCGDHPAAEFNAKFRKREGLPCGVCHPSQVA